MKVTTDWCAPAGIPNGIGPSTNWNGHASPLTGVNELLAPRLRLPEVGIGADAPVKGARNDCGADTPGQEIESGMSVGEKNAVRFTVNW